MVQNLYLDSSSIPAIASTIINAVIATEGSFANIKGDPGGTTMYGIAAKFAELVDRKVAEKIRNNTLSIDDAKCFYFKYYYLRYNISSYRDDRLKYFMFDSRVAGLGWFTYFIQLALDSLGKIVKADGKFGPLTDAAIRSMDSDEVSAFLHYLQDNSGEQAEYWKSCTTSGRRMPNVRAAGIQRRLLIRTQMALTYNFYKFLGLAKDMSLKDGVQLTQSLVDSARNQLLNEGKVVYT